MGHLVPTRASFRSFGSPSSKQGTSAADHAKERRKASNTSHRRGGDVAQPPLRLSYLCKKCMPCPGHASRNVRTPRRRWFSRILAFGRMARHSLATPFGIPFATRHVGRRSQTSQSDQHGQRRTLGWVFGRPVVREWSTRLAAHTVSDQMEWKQAHPIDGSSS